MGELVGHGAGKAPADGSLLYSDAGLGHRKWVCPLDHWKTRRE